MRKLALILSLLFCCSPAFAGIDFELADVDYYIENSVLFDAGDLPVSVSVWIKPESAVAVTIFSVADSATETNYYRLSSTGGGNLVWQAHDGTLVQPFTSTTWALGEWNHVAMAEYSTSSRAVWLDGGGKGTNVTAITPAGLDRTGIGISAKQTPVVAMDGVIAYLFVWIGYGFTDADALALASGADPRTIAPEFLARGFRMDGDGPVGTRIRDTIGGVDLDDTVNATPVKAESPMIHPMTPSYGLRQPRGPVKFRHWSPDHAYRRDGYALAA